MDPVDVYSCITDSTFLAGLRAEFAPPIFQVPPGMSIKTFNPTRTAAVDTTIRLHGLLATLQYHIDTLRRAAPSSTSVRSAFEMIDTVVFDRLLLVHTHGSDRFTKQSWSPNAGRGFRQSPTVTINSAIVEHKLQQYIEAGLCLVCSVDALSPADLKFVHVNRLLLVSKPNDPTGRLCLDPTNGCPNLPSLNDGVDREKSDVIFPMSKPCNLASIADMLCDIADANPGCPIWSASVDVKSAYQRVLATAFKAAIQCSRVGDKYVFHLTGIFGETRAGHVYDAYRSAFDALHNHGRSYRRSLTYVDDGIIANIATEIRQDLDDYRTAISHCFTPEGIDPKKTSLLEEAMIAIGFHLDLRANVWRVVPKERSRRKLAHVLFNVIPPGCSSVPRPILLSVASLLVWHSQALPVGRNFVYTLFNDFSEGRDDPHSPGNVSLSPGSLADLDFWRGLVALLNFDPHFCGISISLARSMKRPTLYIRADASKLYGCGGFLSRTRDGLAIAACSIQWTTAELSLFRQLHVSINTLEFFGIVYCLLVWSADFSSTCDSLRDAVLHIELGNTAAISFLLKHRSNSSTSAHCVIRLFSLALSRYGWSIDRPNTPHLRGLDNPRADDLSRIKTPIDFSSLDFSLPPQTAPSLAADLSKVGRSVRTLRIEAFCRQLLLDCVTRPASLPTPTLVGRLRSLDSIADSASAL